MAGVSNSLEISQQHEQTEQQEGSLYDIQSLNSSILPWSDQFDILDSCLSNYNIIPSPESLPDSYSDSGSGSGSDYTDSVSDMNFVTNLFEHRRDYTFDDYQNSIFPDSSFDLRDESVGFRVSGSDHEEDLGVGFGFEMDRLESGVSGLRVVGIDSESDVEDEMDRVNDIRFDDEVDGIINEETRWEAVGGEREGFSSVIDRIEEVTVSSEISLEEEDDENDSVNIGDIGLRDLEWEILLAANNFSRDFELENGDGVTYITVQDDYIYAAEYNSLVSQFVDTESALKGSPPAAKSVVENLASVVLTQEYVQENNVVCAVCKDEINVEERAIKLPCSHHYHGECIVPWLNIRNTCPVCRFELPTDDADYERRKDISGQLVDLRLLDDSVRLILGGDNWRSCCCNHFPAENFQFSHNKCAYLSDCLDGVCVCRRARYKQTKQRLQKGN